MKKWYKSKTIWVGILEVAGGTVAAISGMVSTGVPVTIAGVVQIILRLVTKEAVKANPE